MKLVDILARELKVWPADCDSLKQSFGGMVFHGNQAGIIKIARLSISDDWRKAEVTRHQWQAAVDALKAGKEKVMVIDWSKAPEGFPLWLEGTNAGHRKASGWYREKGLVYEGAHGIQWRACREGQFFTVHRQPALDSWTGEGLPPAGEVCEVDGGSSADGWGRCVIRYSSADVIVFKRDERGFESFDCTGGKYSFRPIRTTEQIAAEERETNSFELFSVINWNDSRDQWDRMRESRKDDYRKAIDAGYRKVTP